MTKDFITFTDIIEKKNRRILNNKVTFLTANKNAWNEFNDFITKIFDFQKFDKIKGLSDAGTWIVNGIPDLKLFNNNEIIHCLCIFHAFNKVKRMKKCKNQRRLLIGYIKDDKKKNFIELSNSIVKDLNDKKKVKFKTNKNYLIKYWKAVQNMFNNEIGSSMESHISHNIAKYFSYETKAYSKKELKNI